MLYLDGFPPGRRDDYLDVTHAACEAGWSTLYIQYRGMWESEGSFSIRNSIEDIRTAIAYVKGLPTRPLAIAGYSFSGYGALVVSAEDAEIDCTISIDAADHVVRGRRFAEDEAYLNSFRDYSVAFIGPGLPFPELDIDALFEEHMALPESAELKHLADELASRRMLLLSSNLETHSAGRVRYYAPLLAGLEAAGAPQLTTRMIDADHDFTGKHEEVREIVTEWLNAECTVSGS